MALKWIECVPNFSEGRRIEVIEEILNPFRKTKGCHLLDHSSDPDHNRLVVTLVGEPEAICRALIEASKVAIETIDLNHHRGAHPRMGAIDVIPFVPLLDTTIKECVEIAHEFGQAFYRETSVPVYFYEEAALRPDRKKLEDIRRGQFEGLKEDIYKPERHPDIGPPQLHPTAGATAIGARRLLVAFNVNLRTRDLEVAREIARALRASSGGLAFVKAMGVDLSQRGMVQVSMNLVDFEKNPLYRVLEMVRMEARRWGVSIEGCEIEGVVPAMALIKSAEYYLQLKELEPSRILELALLEMMKECGKEA